MNDDKDLAIKLSQIRMITLEFYEGDVEIADTWLNTKIQILGFKTPLQYADSVSNAQIVINIIGRLKTGETIS